MKYKNITVRVPDFCPEDCREFEIIDNTGEYLIADDGTIRYAKKEYTCENEGRCRHLVACLDAMKERGEDAGMENRPAGEDGLV